jgi:hypothetical protein
VKFFSVLPVLNLDIGWQSSPNLGKFDQEWIREEITNVSTVYGIDDLI